MILAAGLGTRLKPLTDQIPKALITVNNKPLIQLVIEKLITFGINEIIINIHHQAKQIIDFIQSKKFFDIKIEFSHEEILLDTGGGLKKAAWFFNRKEPFILYNVDVLSDIDLDKMLYLHNYNKADVTLAMRNRRTSRYLLFDKKDQLIGWRNLNDDKIVQSMIKSTMDSNLLSFMGIHIISPEILPKIPEKKIFSIIEFYLNLAQKGAIIQAFHADAYYWFDLGKPQNIKEADHYLQSIQSGTLSAER
jgi:NDP-sugar pyrophosphorylase family protein